MTKHLHTLLIASFAWLPVAGWAQSPRAARSASANNELRLEDPVITLKNEVNIPARDAGVLKTIAAEEGDEVEKDSLLAQLDETEVKFKLAGAKAEVTVAKAEAKSE